MFLNTRTNKSTVIFNVTAYGKHSYTLYEVCGSCIPHLRLTVHMVQSKGSTITQSPSNSKICWWYFNLYTVTAFWRTVTSHSPLQLGLVQRYTLSTFTRLWHQHAGRHVGITVGYLHLCASYLETYQPSLLHFIRTKTMNFYIMYAINILSDSCRLPHTGSSADERWGGEAGANYRGPAVRNGARGPIVVHIYLSR